MDAPVLLTLDLGNTRLKLALWRAHECLARTALPAGRISGAGLAERATAWLEQHARPLAGALCSVGDPELTRVLERQLGACTQRGALEVPGAGLEVAVQHSETVGRDRLFAARGALERLKRSCIVLNLGTCMTVDALEWRAGQGRFLGGAIAPGPSAWAAGMVAAAARLPLVEPRVGVPALGRDSEAALRAGVFHGLRGAARELARQVAREAFPGEPLPGGVLSGGAASLLLEPSCCLEGGWVHEPELVSLGLERALSVHLWRER